MSPFLALYPELDLSEPFTSVAAPSPFPTSGPTTIAEFDFDPEIFFRRTVILAPPDERAAFGRHIRGPVGGADAWVGRDPTLPMSRAIGCHGSSNSVIGCVGSSKMSGMLGAESGGEFSAGPILDAAPNVKTIRAQGNRCNFRLFGRARYTTPDFEVELYEGRPHVLEVKPDDVASSPDFRMRAHAIARACARKGQVYGVLTKSFLRRQPLQNNVRLLRRYRLSPLTASDWRSIERVLRDAPLTAEALCIAAQASFQAVCAAIYRGHLAIDFNKPFSAQALVWLP